MTSINWYEHAVLFKLKEGGPRKRLSGELHALVTFALLCDRLDTAMIKTDSGKMFCRHEIHYISMLAERPIGRARETQQ